MTQTSDPLIERLRRYDPISILTALSAAAAYPPNAVFLERFEYFVHRVVALKPPFGALDVASHDLAMILSSIPSDEDSRLALMEDFAPSNNLEDVYFCWEGTPQRFFFGSLERPLAYLEKYATEASALDEWILRRYGFSLSSVLSFTLAFHHHLLSNLVDYLGPEQTTAAGSTIPEAPISPPDEFIEFWRSVPPTGVDDLLKFASNRDEASMWMQLFTAPVESGNDSDQIAMHPLALSSFIELNGRVLAPLPQLGVEQLLNQLAFLVNQDTEHRGEIAKRFWRYTCSQTILTSLRLFADGSMSQVIPDVEVVSGSSQVPLVMLVSIDGQGDPMFGRHGFG